MKGPAVREVNYYFFEYDRPGKRVPGRTRWRMSIDHAAAHYPGYRPILNTVEVRRISETPEEKAKDGLPWQAEKPSWMA